MNSVTGAETEYTKRSASHVNSVMRITADIISSSRYTWNTGNFCRCIIVWFISPPRNTNCMYFNYIYIYISNYNIVAHTLWLTWCSYFSFLLYPAANGCCFSVGRMWFSSLINPLENCTTHTMPTILDAIVLGRSILWLQEMWPLKIFSLVKTMKNMWCKLWIPMWCMQLSVMNYSLNAVTLVDVLQTIFPKAFPLRKVWYLN